MIRTSAISSLTAAANALKSAGATANLETQINSVSNALTGSQRMRVLSEKSEGRGLPANAENVLENIRIQVGNALTSMTQARDTDSIDQKFVQDLEIIEGFTARVIKHYNADEAEICKSVSKSIAQAKSEIVTLIALAKIEGKIHNLEWNYQNNPRMSQKDYQDELHELTQSVRVWEDELLPADPLLRDSPGMLSRIVMLKTELESAGAVAELGEHPGVVAEVSLNVLRVATQMMQASKTQFEVQQAIQMAIDANHNLSKSGKQFQEAARALNLLLEQSIAMFVDKKLKSLENEVNAPVYLVPGDVGANSKIADRLNSQKERLLVYVNFVQQWSGPHKEDLLERMALIHEIITDRAEKAREFVLDESVKPD